MLASSKAFSLLTSALKTNRIKAIYINVQSKHIGTIKAEYSRKLIVYAPLVVDSNKPNANIATDLIGNDEYPTNVAISTPITINPINLSPFLYPTSSQIEYVIAHIIIAVEYRYVQNPITNDAKKIKVINNQGLPIIIFLLRKKFAIL